MHLNQSSRLENCPTISNASFNFGGKMFHQWWAISRNASGLPEAHSSAGVLSELTRSPRSADDNGLKLPTLEWSNHINLFIAKLTILIWLLQKLKVLAVACVCRIETVVCLLIFYIVLSFFWSTTNRWRQMLHYLTFLDVNKPVTATVLWIMLVVLMNQAVLIII